MKAATAPGPDHVSVDFLQAGGHRLQEMLADIYRPTFKRKGYPTNGEPQQSFFIRRAIERIFGTTVQYAC
ncbi:unnamed protein product [Strongylus vulgaris]|uniref:Uncharacterized protein n=1 Tax=Strongylus vulgaris TaxID=40348 RepID=A0A3P7JIS9_STRVU|nr:unnamed protein product [Strongylus vulgaris]